MLLLHGLWMAPAAMGLLDGRLQRAGFVTERFGYSSVRGGPEQAIPALAERMRAAPCHVVAHSLGGLITLRTLETQADLPVARVVCLGSPLCGSSAARGFRRLPWIGRAVGRSSRLLLRGCRPWRGAAQVGMVAGWRPIGLGQFLGHFDGDSDGTVAVAETCLDGLADHIVVATSHTGMLVSPHVAEQAIAFLRTGRFAH